MLCTWTMHQLLKGMNTLFSMRMCSKHLCRVARNMGMEKNVRERGVEWRRRKESHFSFPATLFLVLPSLRHAKEFLSTNTCLILKKNFISKTIMDYYWRDRNSGYTGSLDRISCAWLNWLSFHSKASLTRNSFYFGCADALYLQIGRSDWPVLTNGKRP